MKLSDSSPRAMRVTSCSRACAAPLRGVPTPRHASFRQRPGRRPLRYARLRSVRGGVRARARFCCYASARRSARVFLHLCVRTAHRCRSEITAERIDAWCASAQPLRSTAVAPSPRTALRTGLDSLVEGISARLAEPTSILPLVTPPTRAGRFASAWHCDVHAAFPPSRLPIAEDRAPCLAARTAAPRCKRDKRGIPDWS